MTKPILFNTEMVRAILAGAKTVTRRVVKPQPARNLVHVCDGTAYGCWMDQSGQPYRPPYRPGDILYVRETWSFCPCSGTCENACDTTAPNFYKGYEGCFVYRLDYGNTEDDSFPPSMFKWHPSIHMPKEAARLFLRVTDVRAERLQDITEEQARAEGAEPFRMTADVDKPDNEKHWEEKLPALVMFPEIWNSTIKPADRAVYGWGANPWVWVVEFERCEKPQPGAGGRCRA